MKRTILLVTNNLLTHEVLCRPLEAADCEVVLAVNVRESLEKCAVAHPDLLVADLDWPFDGGGDVRDVAKQALEIWPSLPIIVISARSELSVAVESLGVAAVAEKPPDVPALLKTADELIAKPEHVTGNGDENHVVNFRR